MCLSWLWRLWRCSLLILQPAAVLAWHRQGFQLYWRWRSRSAPIGRPRIDAQLRTLIRHMARENPTWGRRRIQAELHLLGYDVAELTVAKYMRRPSRRPSPTWRTFLTTHLRDIVAIDFFVVPTLTFRLLFAFIVLRHDRRELVHVNVTDHPTDPAPRWSASLLSARCLIPLHSKLERGEDLRRRLPSSHSSPSGHSAPRDLRPSPPRDLTASGNLSSVWGKATTPTAPMGFLTVTGAHSGAVFGN